jgi:hypothetical protein
MTGQWFSLGTKVSSTNKTDCHDIAEILLKVVLNTITLTLYLYLYFRFFTEIASDCDIPDTGNHSLSFINDANVLALHRLLWNNQEKIGDYLSSSRYTGEKRQMFLLILIDIVYLYM